MEIGLLGAVRIEGTAVPVDLGPRRQRFVLGLLALEANRVVPVDRIVDLAWPVSPPRTAAHAIRVCVSGLRQALAAAGAISEGVELATAGSGYQLKIDPHRVDVHRFRAEVGRARQLTGDEQRIATLEAALVLWTGPPLDGVMPAEIREQLCAGLEEGRLGALENLFEAYLRLGRHQQVLDRLAGLVATHPLREGLVGQLMLALYRAGRTAEALATYRKTRHLLAEELGMDPGAELRRLELGILRNDAQLGQPQPASAQSPHATNTSHTSPPAQLPTAVTGFVGRDSDLERLDSIVSTGEPAMTVALIVGTAGVGKTALALRWAHQARDRFPDGQLYLNLRGFDTDQPVPPLRALATLLTGLGTPAARIPSEVDQASALFRSQLAGRRILLLLDNAATTEQVRPLLPGSAASAVVVTSRNWLTGLIALEGAQHVQLEPLPTGDAIDLLGKLVGPSHGRETAKLAELARLCARLPLALRIAAAHLRTHPMQTIGGYLAELTHGDRLAILSTDDERAAVRSTFELSYQRLSEVDQSVFRLFGVVPGPDLTTPAAAAMTGAGERETAAALERLSAAGLLQHHQPGRYQPHDLLRLYATEVATAQPHRAASDAARHRLYDWYLERATAAAETLYPQTLRLPDSARPPATGTHQDAQTWLQDEQANLVAAVTVPATEDLAETRSRLADALRGYFLLRRDAVDWLAVATAAQQLANRLEHPTIRAAACLNLASAYGCVDDPRAVEQYGTAAALAGQAGWPQAEAACLTNAGIVRIHGGDLAQGVEQLSQALAAQRKIGMRPGEAAVLSGLGLAYHWLGQPRQAIDHHSRSLAIYRELGAHSAQASAAVNLAYAYIAAGDLDSALLHTNSTLPILQEVGTPSGEALALDNLSRIHLERGDHDQALQYAERAVTLGVNAGDRIHATALTTQASCLAALGEHEKAIDSYTRALDLAHDAGTRYVHTEARIGLARTTLALGRDSEARHHAHTALNTALAHGFGALAQTSRTVLAEIG